MAPELIYQLFLSNRVQFTHSVETYPCWVVLMPDDGAFTYRLDEETGECGPGEFVLCPPKMALHRKMEGGPSSFHFFRFRWKSTTAAGKKSLRDRARHESNLRTFRRLAELEDYPEARAWSAACLGDMLAQAEFESAYPRLGQESSDRRMAQVARKLENSFHQTIDLASLARSLRLTPSQFSRRYQAAFGISPRARLSTLRIDHAKRLLLETDWSVEKIAEACGAEDAFYFSRFFRTHTGVSPRTFRQERAL